MATRFPRLMEIFGAAPEDATAAVITRLVTPHQEETFDLEFKRALYGNGETERTELAQDVAALANTRGGVIILGVVETDGRAESAAPVTLSETEELRMRQIVASLVFPAVEWTIKRVVGPTSDTGWYILLVSAGPSKPHAVFVNAKQLRYPVRDQQRTRFLQESEVADRYRDRFAGEKETVSRLRDIANAGQIRNFPNPGFWAQAAIAPVAPGRFSIEHGACIACQDDLWRRRNLGGIFQTPGVPIVSTGFRHLRLDDQQTGGGPGQFLQGQLYTDGAGTLCRFIPVSPGSTTTEFRLWRLSLPSALAQMLKYLAHHAVNRCGAVSDGLAQVRLVSSAQVVIL